eukprot:10731155-Alexandrium_andersonii.AAC.1
METPPRSSHPRLSAPKALMRNRRRFRALPMRARMRGRRRALLAWKSLRSRRPKRSLRRRSARRCGPL